MKVLLDTNVLSEPSKTRPDPSVAAWFADLKYGDAAASILSIGEIRFGIARMRDVERQSRLERWYADILTPSLSGQVLDIDFKVISAWIDVRLNAGRTIAGVDGLIAATARAHGLTLATRNVRDFADMGVALVNPWGDGSAA